MTAVAVEIVSFGYLHDAPPAAHLTIDLRQHFRDPHVSPELRFMTADDAPVREAVLNTPASRRWSRRPRRRLPRSPPVPAPER